MAPIPYQRILENLSTAVLLLNGQFRLCYMNPAGEMLFQTSVRRGQRLTLGEIIPGNGTFLALLAKSCQSGHPFTEREMLLRLPSEESITVDCTVTPLPESELQGHLLLELAHVDRHLRIAREESLLSQQAASRALVRGLAHEIKNPLGGLRGAAQLLERELPSESLKEYTGVIIREADRLRVLVDHMLGPNRPAERRAVNVYEVLERVRKLVVAEAPQGIVIRRDYDPSIPPVQADPNQLIQAVLNIVRNAVQALGESGTIILRTRVQRQFTIGQRRYKLVLRLEVADNGPGIPSEVQEHLFYPMVTGRAHGTGLGLSIAQSLINQHGGLIEARSEPGETVFTLLLPLRGLTQGAALDEQGDRSEESEWPNPFGTASPTTPY